MAVAVQKETKEIVTSNLKPITYKTADGESVTLTMEAVKRITNNNPYINEGEVQLFMETCKYQKLNPFLKECYLIKYDNSKPATQVISLAAFMKYAEFNPKYEGIEDGIIVKTAKGEIVDRVGCVLYLGEFLLGGWAKVYRSDRRVPSVARSSLKESCAGQAMWTKAPALMVNKIAKVAALRKAFPAAFGGCYIEEELSNDVVNNTEKAVAEEPIYDMPMDDTVADGILEDTIVLEATATESTPFDAEPTNADTYNGKPVSTIEYSAYLANKDRYEKVPNTYNKELRTIQVIEV